MSGATEIVIDDWRDPVFSPAARELLELAAPMAEHLSLSEDAILGQASADLGLDDFGDDGFRAPLRALLASLRDEAGLSAFGTINLHTQLVQLARNRLLVEDQIARHPEILDIEIAAPIIVAGLPRTGTTHLHQLLAADPALRSLPYWESLEPVPIPGDAPGADGIDPRWARTAAACEFMDLAMPHFKAMHEMTPDHVHEEIALLAMDCSTMYFETQAVLPGYRDHYLADDPVPHYRYLRRVLQVCTFLRGGDRWVLKSPQHLERFDALRTVFPDATVVVTHRDPAEVVTSMLMMLTYAARLMVDHPDPEAIAAHWVPRLGDLLDGCRRDRHLLAPERSIDVRFADFMADELGTLDRIDAAAGRAVSGEARAAQAAYLRDHQRDRHGRVRRDLAPFGLTEAELRERFADYASAFGVV